MEKYYEQRLDADCDQIVETEYQLGDLKDEYDYIDDCISDLKLLEKKDSDKLFNAAEKIMDIFKKQNSNEKPMEQRKFFLIHQYRERINDDIGRIKELEEMGSLLKSQLLEQGESSEQSLVKQYKVIEKKDACKWFIASTAAMAVIASIILLVLRNTYARNLIPVIIIGWVLAGAVCAYLFKMYQNCDGELEHYKRKQARAADMHETINNRYENNRFELRYFYAKYGIQNQRELSILLQEYQKIIEADDKDRFQLNKELFQGLDLRMQELWEGHPDLFADSKCMEQMKQYLDTCLKAVDTHQKYNKDLKHKLIRNVKKLISKEPELKNTAIEILSPYEIKL